MGMGLAPKLLEVSTIAISSAWEQSSSDLGNKKSQGIVLLAPVLPSSLKGLVQSLITVAYVQA